jgi:hypothetical protein
MTLWPGVNVANMLGSLRIYGGSKAYLSGDVGSQGVNAPPELWNTKQAALKR